MQAAARYSLQPLHCGRPGVAGRPCMQRQRPAGPSFLHLLAGGQARCPLRPTWVGRSGRSEDSSWSQDPEIEAGEAAMHRILAAAQDGRRGSPQDWELVFAAQELADSDLRISVPKWDTEPQSHEWLSWPTPREFLSRPHLRITPAHLAVMCDDADILKRLAAAGADLDASAVDGVNDMRVSPLEVALICGNAAAYKALADIFESRAFRTVLGSYIAKYIVHRWQKND